MFNHNELLAQAEELAEMLLQEPEIQTYRHAEDQMKANASALAGIRRLRDLQEQIGDMMSRRVPEAYYAHLTTESESLLAELESIPEVQNFLQAQSAVNDLLQAVTTRLALAVESPPTETETKQDSGTISQS